MSAQPRQQCVPRLLTHVSAVALPYPGCVLLVHAPLVGVLNERPGRLLAWQVPGPGGSVDVDTFGGWPVMPVTADADSDLAVLRVVAASGVEGAAAAQVAQAALAAQV